MDLDERTARDQTDRDAIVADLGSTLFVEAGAGSGKTTALVARVLALLDHGIAMENIAAITFTEKAAAELKNRLRHELADSGKHSRALDQLDGAAITTLHGFALRILSLHAIEAGLPPRLEVSPLNAFEDRWAESRARLLHSSDHEHVVVTARAMGIKIGHLRSLAQTLDDNWDMVVERMGCDPLPTGRVALPNLSNLSDQFSDTAKLAQFCSSPDDRLLAKLREIGNAARRLENASGRGDEAVRILFGPLPSFKAGNHGKKGNWPASCPIEEARGKVSDLGDAVHEIKGQIAGTVLDRLARVLGALALEAAQDRRQRGVLEFHDLLVLARELLRHPQHGAAVRSALAERYQRLLLDEFQDTDPIQADLAKLIATPPDGPARRSPSPDEPGRLFYVGDPKQSIYRFRRADIAVFAETGQAGTVVRKSLTRNFRTVEPVIAWINGLFSKLMAPPDPGEHLVQPVYQALDPVRGDPPTGPPVAVLDAEHPRGTRTGSLREAEAGEVAKAVLTAISQGWSVGNGKDGSGRDRWRKAELGDICILLPTRTSLAQLESALQEHDIPYRIEAGSLIWATRAIRDAMSVVRAVADPTDEVALVNALRSPAFGCGDDDLFHFKATHHGRWNFLASPPPSLPEDHPVREALTWLSDLHSQVRWLMPASVLERIVRERRLLETGCFGLPRQRDVWRSLHMAIDQARQFEEDGGRGLRGFIAWVDRKIGERIRESDITISETDDDAVRITTIHAAKGREFPIVILSGTHPRPGSKTANLIWPPEGGFGVRVNNSLVTKTFADHQGREEQMDDAERVRLLYVACTRARDHLVVSAHRTERSDGSRAKLSMAEMVAVHADELPQATWQPEPLASKEAEAPFEASFAQWQNERSTVLGAAQRPLALSASSIASRFAPDNDPGLAKDGLDDEDEPQSPGKTGRYGTKVGRAVHGVLQTVDLGGDADAHLVDPVAVTQVEREGIPEAQQVVRGLAQSALNSNTVRAAGSGEHWKELFVAAPINGIVVEGYIDLLHRADDGLVVVDYKTDDVGDDEALQAKVDRYQLQVAAYALAAEQAIGEPVARCVLVFAQNGRPAREITIANDDLAAAQREVRRRLALQP